MPTAVAPASASELPATLIPSTVTEPTATALQIPLAESGLGDRLAHTGYQVPLTVRHLTPTTASFSFVLQEPQPGFLLYRPDLPDLSGWFTVPLDPQVNHHRLRLDRLQPEQAYLVHVGLEQEGDQLHPVGLGGRVWGPLRFTTPAEASSPLRIGVIGDSGYGEPTTAMLAEEMRGRELDFVLHTGDVVYNVQDEGDPALAWALKYYWPFALLLEQLPIYAVPGNHEYDQAAQVDGQPFYFSAFAAPDDPALHATSGFPWYAFSWSDIQFLMLDSQLFHGVAGRSEQTVWLRERLEDPSYRYSIAVFHTPPYTSGLHTHDAAALRAEWTPLFEAARVPLVISGHDHNYERVVVNEVTYLVSGGGSRVLYSFRSAAPGSQVFARESHFVVLEIDASQIGIVAISLQGEVIDRAVIEAPR